MLSEISQNTDSQTETKPNFNTKLKKNSNELDDLYDTLNQDEDLNF